MSGLNVLGMVCLKKHSQVNRCTCGYRSEAWRRYALPGKNTSPYSPDSEGHGADEIRYRV